MEMTKSAFKYLKEELFSKESELSIIGKTIFTPILFPFVITGFLVLIFSELVILVCFKKDKE